MAREAWTTGLFVAGVTLASIAALDWLGYAAFVFRAGLP